MASRSSMHPNPSDIKRYLKITNRVVFSCENLAQHHELFAFKLVRPESSIDEMKERQEEVKERQEEVQEFMRECRNLHQENTDAEADFEKNVPMLRDVPGIMWGSILREVEEASDRAFAYRSNLIPLLTNVRRQLRSEDDRIRDAKDELSGNELNTVLADLLSESYDQMQEVRERSAEIYHSAASFYLALAKPYRLLARHLVNLLHEENSPELSGETENESSGNVSTGDQCENSGTVHDIEIDFGDECYVLRAAEKEPVEIPANRVKLFAYFVAKVHKGHASEAVSWWKLNDSVAEEDDPKPVPRDTASTKLRNVKKKLVGLMNRLGSTPDGGDWIDSTRFEGYFLNPSVKWELSKKVKSLLSKRSGTGFQTHDPRTIEENTPDRDSSLPARPRRKKPSDSSEADWD